MKQATKLVDLTWSCYRVPFRNRFHTAHGTLSYRSGALVSMRTDNGYVGYGEIAPLPTQSGPGLGESLNALPRLARTLPGQELSAIARFLETQSADGQLPAALICGLETALFDVLGQTSSLRVADLLAGDDLAGKPDAPPTSRAYIPVNTVIGASSIEATIASAQTAIADGFTCLKLKLTDA